MKPVDMRMDGVMNKAIGYLAGVLEASGHNSKPVLLHSIRVGFRLHELGYGEDVIVAGILHDVLEDTDTQESEIASRFGNTVAGVVAANSFDSRICDKTERYQEMFARCALYGKDALVVKAVDILDNSNYIQFVDDGKMVDWLTHKMKVFLEISSGQLGDEAVWMQLSEQYSHLRGQFNSLQC